MNTIHLMDVQPSSRLAVVPLTGPDHAPGHAPGAVISAGCWGILEVKRSGARGRDLSARVELPALWGSSEEGDL